jgi:hypothetical protein
MNNFFINRRSFASLSIFRKSFPSCPGLRDNFSDILEALFHQEQLLELYFQRLASAVTGMAPLAGRAVAVAGYYLTFILDNRKCFAHWGEGWDAS